MDEDRYDYADLPRGLVEEPPAEAPMYGPELDPSGMGGITSTYEITGRTMNPGEARAPRLPSLAPTSTFGWKDFVTPAGLMATLSTGLGLGSNLYQTLKANQERNRLISQARKPIDPTQYYQPMSKIEEDALRRELMSQYVLRGVPIDSAAMSNMVAEAMAKSNYQRWKDAASLAERQRSGIINAMQSPIPTMNWGNTVTPIASYLQMLMTQQARQRAEATQREWYKDLLEMYRTLGSRRLPQLATADETQVTLPPYAYGGRYGEDVTNEDEEDINTGENE